MFKHPTRCLAAAAHFLITKELFNSKYPQLQVAKDFAVAEKKLHLATSRRKYDPGKKAPKKRHTSNGKTAAPKPSTSQEQPQSESISEQQPQSESVTEQQPQSKTTTDTQQEHVPSQFSLPIQKRKARYKQGDSCPYVFSLSAKCAKIF